MSLYCVGLDLGQQQDYTACAVLQFEESTYHQVTGRNISPPVYQLRHLERFKLKTPYPEIVARVGELMAAPALQTRKDRPMPTHRDPAAIVDWQSNPYYHTPPTLVVDATGVGAPVCDLLRAARIPFSGVLITGGEEVTPPTWEGTAVHELGHALGLHHEQSRNDRDRYVRIAYENVNPKYKSNLDKKWNDAGPYDYNSIMHYGATAFSINGKPTIISPQPIGQRDYISSGDIGSVRKIYPNDVGAIDHERTHDKVAPPKPIVPPVQSIQAMLDAEFAKRGVTDFDQPGVIGKYARRIHAKLRAAAIKKLNAAAPPSGGTSRLLNALTGRNLYDPGSETFYGGLHRGWDLRSAVGDTRVFAPRGGYWNPYDAQGHHNIGGWLDSTGGVRDMIHHLVGTRGEGTVKQGDVLGRYAQVGTSNTPHVHFERYINGRYQTSPSAYGLNGSDVYRHGGGPMGPNRQYIVKNGESAVFTGPGSGGHVTPPNRLSVPLAGGGEMTMVVIHAMVQREHEQYIRSIANPAVPPHQIIRSLERARSGGRY